MFVRSYVDLPLGRSGAEEEVERLPIAVLQRLVQAGYARGRSLLAADTSREGTAHNGHGPSGEVAVERFAPVRLGTASVVPMSWLVGPEALLPSLEVDMEVGALGNERSHLALNARYRRPPGGASLTRPDERELEHRVVEVVVADVLAHLRAYLLDGVRPPG